MVDFLSSAARSERMSRIRGKDTKPELVVRKLLHAAGYRYRLHVNSMFGRPDIVLPRYKAVIFVHGCFWHRHSGCSVATMPKSNRPFWLAKFARNVERDRQNRTKLRKLGWRVFVVWECEVSSVSRSLKAIQHLDRRLRRLVLKRA